jgi:amino acid permease
VEKKRKSLFSALFSRKKNKGKQENKSQKLININNERFIFVALFSLVEPTLIIKALPNIGLCLYIISSPVCLSSL